MDCFHSPLVVLLVAVAMVLLMVFFLACLFCDVKTEQRGIPQSLADKVVTEGSRSFFVYTIFLHY